MRNFTQKVAIRTGGNSGIGYGATKLLKEQGADVIINRRAY